MAPQEGNIQNLSRGHFDLPFWLLSCSKAEKAILRTGQPLTIACHMKENLFLQ
jgi:hypothetical protein